jgi:hypothetical protein
MSFCVFLVFLVRVPVRGGLGEAHAERRLQVGVRRPEFLQCVDVADTAPACSRASVSRSWVESSMPL